MNPGVLYLYECKSRTRIRNVGFIRIAQPSPSCYILQIHARNLNVHPNGQLLLYPFYRDEEQIFAKKAAALTCGGRSLSARTVLGCGNSPLRHPLDRLNGFLLAPEESVPETAALFWLASDSLFPLHTSKITILSDKVPSDETPSDTTQSDDTLSGRAQTDIQPDDRSREDGSQSDTAQSGDTLSGRPQTDAQPDDRSREDGSPSDTAQSGDAQTGRTQTDVQLDDKSHSSETPSSTAQSDVTQTGISQTDDRPHVDSATLPENVRLITREELTILPRRLWSLANNSFLLHGCHNYGCLLLFLERGRVWLGIPGTYSRQEARAADYFGFPRFTYDYRYTYMYLPEGSSCSTSALCHDAGHPDTAQTIPPDFGHWCRCLGLSSKDQKFPFIS